MGFLFWVFSVFVCFCCQVPLSIYLHYPKAGGITLMAVAALCFASFRASSVAASFWLRQWTDDPTLANQSAWGSEAFVNTNQYYLTYYGVFGILQCRYRPV